MQDHGSPLVIGIAGGTGSGKSTVAARLRELRIPVLDADRLVRDLYEPGRAGAAAAPAATAAAATAHPAEGRAPGRPGG